MQVVRQPIAEQPDRGRGFIFCQWFYILQLYSGWGGGGESPAPHQNPGGEGNCQDSLPGKTAAPQRPLSSPVPRGSQGVQPRLRFRVVQAFTNVVCLGNRRSHQGTLVGLFPAPAGHIVSVR